MINARIMMKRRLIFGFPSAEIRLPKRSEPTNPEKRSTNCKTVKPIKVKNKALNEPPISSEKPIAFQVLANPMAKTLAGPAVREKLSPELKVPEETPNVAANIITTTTMTVSPNIAPLVIGIANGSFSIWCEVENVDTIECHPDTAPLDRVTKRIGQIGPKSGWKVETKAGISKTALIDPLSVPNSKPTTARPRPSNTIQEDT